MLRLTLPPKATEVLGEEAATELAQWIAETIAASRDQLVLRNEYREVLSRLDIIEHDLAGVKEHLNVIDARFDAMEERFDNRFDRMGERFDARFDAMGARIDTIHDTIRSQTRWLITTLIAVGGLISVLITVFKFIQ